MRARVVALLLGTMVLAGCAAPDPTGGVQGTVWLGPTCPVVQDPPDPDCDDQPYQTELVVVRAGTNDVVERFSSDENGTFHEALQPGTYEIRRPPDATQPPTCQAGPFDVEVGRYTNVTVSCDSGIR